MATEKEANKARDLHADRLESMGVHSLGVNLIGKKGSKDFCVVAFVEKHIKNLPTELEVPSGKKKVSVPLTTRLSSKFKAE